MTAEETTPKPLLNTEEPICPKGENACADGTCIPTSLFCDGHPGLYYLQSYKIYPTHHTSLKIAKTGTHHIVNVYVLTVFIKRYVCDVLISQTICGLRKNIC